MDTLWASLATGPITGPYAAVAGRVRTDLQKAWEMLDRSTRQKIEALDMSVPATEIIRLIMPIDMNLYRAAAAVVGIQAAFARTAGATARATAGATAAATAGLRLPGKKSDHPSPDYLAFDYPAAFELTQPQ